MASLMRDPSIFIPEDFEEDDICVIEDAEVVKGNIGKEVKLHKWIPGNTTGIMTDDKGRQTRFHPANHSWIVYSAKEGEDLLALFADGRIYKQEYILVQDIHLKLVKKKVRPDIGGLYQSRIHMISG